MNKKEYQWVKDYFDKMFPYDRIVIDSDWNEDIILLFDNCMCGVMNKKLAYKLWTLKNVMEPNKYCSKDKLNIMSNKWSFFKCSLTPEQMLAGGMIA